MHDTHLMIVTVVVASTLDPAEPPAVYLSHEGRVATVCKKKKLVRRDNFVMHKREKVISVLNDESIEG